MTKHIIVVAGNMNSGKDTFADMLADELRARDQGVARGAFADPLKAAAHHILGIPRDVARGTAADKAAWRRYDRSAREWMQWLGTEVGRGMIHPDVWVHRAGDAALDAYEGDWLVLSDGRFMNELTGLRKYVEGEAARRGIPAPAVTNILIHRPSLPEPGPETHSSEAEIARIRRAVISGSDVTEAGECIPPGLFGRVVFNSGTLRDLRSTAGEIADYLMRLVPG